MVADAAQTPYRQFDLRSESDFENNDEDGVDGILPKYDVVYDLLNSWPMFCYLLKRRPQARKRSSLRKSTTSQQADSYGMDGGHLSSIGEEDSMLVLDMANESRVLAETDENAPHLRCFVVYPSDPEAFEAKLRSEFTVEKFSLDQHYSVTKFEVLQWIHEGTLPSPNMQSFLQYFPSLAEFSRQIGYSPFECFEIAVFENRISGQEKAVLFGCETREVEVLAKEYMRCIIEDMEVVTDGLQELLDLHVGSSSESSGAFGGDPDAAVSSMAAQQQQQQIEANGGGGGGRSATTGSMKSVASGGGGSGGGGGGNSVRFGGGAGRGPILPSTELLRPQQIEDRVDIVMEANSGVWSMDEIRSALKDLQRFIPQLTRRWKNDVIRAWPLSLKPSGVVPFSHVRSFYFSLLKDETVPFHRSREPWLEFVDSIDVRYRQEFQQLIDLGLSMNKVVFVLLKFRLKVFFSNVSDATRFASNGDVVTEVNARLERTGDRLVVDHASPVFRLQRGKQYLLEGEGIGARLESFSSKLSKADFYFEDS